MGEKLTEPGRKRRPPPTPTTVRANHTQQLSLDNWQEIFKITNRPAGSCWNCGLVFTVEHTVFERKGGVGRLTICEGCYDNAAIRASAGAASASWRKNTKHGSEFLDALIVVRPIKCNSCSRSFTHRDEVNQGNEPSPFEVITFRNGFERLKGELRSRKCTVCNKIQPATVLDAAAHGFVPVSYDLAEGAEGLVFKRNVQPVMINASCLTSLLSERFHAHLPLLGFVEAQRAASRILADARFFTLSGNGRKALMETITYFGLAAQLAFDKAEAPGIGPCFTCAKIPQREGESMDEYMSRGGGVHSLHMDASNFATQSKAKTQGDSGALLCGPARPLLTTHLGTLPCYIGAGNKNPPQLDAQGTPNDCSAPAELGVVPRLLVDPSLLEQIQILSVSASKEKQPQQDSTCCAEQHFKADGKSISAAGSGSGRVLRPPPPPPCVTLNPCPNC